MTEQLKWLYKKVIIETTESFLRVAFLSVCLICLFSFQANAQAKEISQGIKKLSYTLEPIHGNYALRFRVELRFEGDSTGSTTLILPSSWSTQSRLFNAVKKLELLTAGAKLLDTLEPNVKKITHAPSQELHIKYELVQDSIGPPSTERGASYRPILEPSYFHFLGNAWVRPHWDESEDVAFSLNWVNVQKGWTICNSFGANQTQQTFQISLGGFLRAVYVGGDFRVRSVEVSGKPIFIAMRGLWTFKDEEFADLVQKIVHIERSFWNDFDYPYYLITLLPLEDTQAGAFYGGTGLTQSFAAFATKNIKLDSMKPLLAHELFHNWNPARLGKPKRPEQLLYWFTEGFTDYYADLLLLRGGLITLDEYVSGNNAMLRNYYVSSFRNATNEQILKDFFKNDEISKIPYWRGRLLATNWNALIQSATNGKYSLDNVMRDLFNEANKQKGKELTLETIAMQVGVYAKQDVMADLNRYIEDGETIAPNKNALGQCVELEIVEMGTFELGFDLRALRLNKIITGVKPDTEAYKAGIRDGQKVMRHSTISHDDSTKKIYMTIRDGEGIKSISFYPAGPVKMRAPQYKIKTGASNKDPSNCTQNAVVFKPQ